MAKSHETEGTDVYKLVSGLGTRGAEFIAVRNVVIVHLLWTGLKASEIASNTGVHASEISRFAKAVREILAPAKGNSKAARDYRAIKALDVSAIDLDNHATIKTLVPLGIYFVRTDKATGASGGAAKGKGQGKAAPADSDGETPATDKVSQNGQTENTDMLATVFDFLVNAPNFALAVALVQSAIDRAEIAVAEMQAEADAD